MFVPERIIAARKRRGLTITALSGRAGLSTKSVSDFENSKKVPSGETISRLATALEVPRDYFGRPALVELPAAAVSFRAATKMSARVRDMALSVASHAVELSRWIDANYNTPDVDIPTLHRHIGLRDAAAAASIVRARWGIGELPLGNMVHLLELHGVAVFSIKAENGEFDAFSFRENGRPFVLLSTVKSAERGRFDAAHELGHLVLHGEAATPTGLEAEREADAFAAAFLMPEADLRANMPSNSSVEVLLSKKRRWGVSAMALAYRLHDLGMLSDWQYHTTCVNLSRRGFRSGEPGGMDRESSKLLGQIVTDLRSTRGGYERLRRELALENRDLDDLIFGLAPVVLEGNSETSPSKKPALYLVEG